MQNSCSPNAHLIPAANPLIPARICHEPPRVISKEIRNSTHVTFAVYARYSDDSQKATSLDDQIRMCVETAQRMGFVVSPDLVFKDDAISGQAKKTHKRTQYLALREAIRAGTIDVLICDQQCRLARSARESLAFLDEIHQHNVRLLTADGFDSSHPTAQLIFGIKSVFSEFFIEETRHRVLRSMNGEFERGGMVTTLPYGYDIDLVRSNATGQCHWAINPAEASVVAELFNHRKNGMSLNQIAAVFNGRGVPTRRQGGQDKTLYWRASAVWRMLENPMYKGLYQVTFGRGKGDELTVQQRLMPELALVSEDAWQAVQAMGRRHKVLETPGSAPERMARGPYGGGKHALAGVFRCGACGVHLSCHHATGDAGTLHCIQCEHATTVGVPGRKPLHLSVKGVRVMLRWLLSRMLSPQMLARYRERLQQRMLGGRDGELQQAQADLAKAERSRTRLARLLQEIEDDDAELEARYHATRSEVLALNNRVQTLQVAVDDVNQDALQKQLGLDISDVVDRFLCDDHAPERTRALLNRIFPALILRHKTNRYTALFEVHVKPGAIFAEGTETPVLVDGNEVLWVELKTSGSKYPEWSVTEIEPFVPSVAPEVELA